MNYSTQPPQGALKPSVEITIEDKQFRCLLDFGCGYDLVLQDRVLKQIRKKVETAEVQIGDIKGNHYPSVLYFLPKIKIGSIFFERIETVSDVKEFYSNALMGPSLSEEDRREKVEKRTSQFDGKIGWPLLQKYDCFIDFPNSRSCVE